jgi:CheY-like chemotaxis protein
MSGSLSGHRILVVEDEIMVSWVLESMLVDLGCTVVGPATRVNEALTLLDTEAFDAVVLDINLNGEKSYPVADALAARGVPFIFSTGYHKNSLPVGYQRFPMLQKPYGRSKLTEALETLLTRRKEDA